MRFMAILTSTSCISWWLQQSGSLTEVDNWLAWERIAEEHSGTFAAFVVVVSVVVSSAAGTAVADVSYHVSAAADLVVCPNGKAISEWGINMMEHMHKTKPIT